MGFHLVEVGIFVPVAFKVFRTAESIEIREYGVSFDVAGVGNVDVFWVGVHRHDFFLYLVGRFREVDAVAEALRHFCLAVGARKTEACCVVWQHDGRLHECFAVDIVEAAHDFRCLFNHRFLVFSGRHGGGAEGRDVGGLADGVGEEAYGDAAFEAAHLDFRLHGWVALQAAYADEVHEIEREFAELRNLALDEKRHLFRVEAAGKVVERHLNDILAHLFRVIDVVGEGLCVGDEYEHLLEVAFVLEFYAAA